MPQAPAPDSFDIAWFSFIDEELKAAHAALDIIYNEDVPDYKSRHGLVRDDNIYYFGKIDAFNIVLSRPPGGHGAANAASAFRDLTRSFVHLQYYLVVGVAGGVPYEDPSKPDIRLGDVVVGIPAKDHPGVITLEYGRRKSEFEPTGTILPPEDSLQQCTSYIVDPIQPINQYLSQFNSNAENLLQKRDIERPHDDHDRLFRADYDCQSQYKKCPAECSLHQLVRRPRRPQDHSTVHCGLIASGSSVIQAAKFRDEQVEEHALKSGDILCFEMEAYAVAFRQRCLVVRGICDYADKHKTYHWQPYAAVRAAAFTKTIVEILGVLRPPRASNSISVERSPLTPEVPVEASRAHIFPELYGISDAFQPCKFSIRWAKVSASKSPTLEFEPHFMQDGFCAIKYCRVKGFRLPSKILALISKDQSFKVQCWVPPDNVRVEEYRDGLEYIWSDLNSIAASKRNGYDMFAFCYNPERPNLSLRIEFDESINSTYFCDDMLDTGLEEAGLRSVGDIDRPLKDLHGSRLNLYKALQNHNTGSHLEDRARKHGLSLIMEIVVPRTTHTISVLSESLKVNIRLAEDSAHTPEVELSGFKVLRYATETLSIDDRHRPHANVHVYRLQQQSKTGVPTQEIWISPRDEIGELIVKPDFVTLRVLVETFQAILERTTSWQSVFCGKVESLKIRNHRPWIQDAVVFLGRLPGEPLHVVAFSPATSNWAFFEIRSAGQTEFSVKDNILSLDIKSWEKLDELKLEILGKPLAKGSSTLKIKFKDWNDIHRFRTSWTQLQGLIEK